MSNSLEPDQAQCLVGPDLVLIVCKSYQQTTPADKEFSQSFCHFLLCSLGFIIRFRTKCNINEIFSLYIRREYKSSLNRNGYDIISPSLLVVAILSSTDYFCKQFGPRSGQTQCRA